MINFAEFTDKQLSKYYYSLRKKVQFLITNEIELPEKEKLIDRIVLKIDKSRNSKEVKKEFYAFLLEYLTRELRHLSVIYYCFCRTADLWFGFGEERVDISYCRNFMGIDNYEDVTQYDVDMMFRKIRDEEKKMNLSIHTADQYQKYFHDYEFDFFGARIKAESLKVLNKDFERLGFPYKIKSEIEYGMVSFLFYKPESNDGRVEIAGKEIVRSPSYILSLASFGDLVRRESLEVICKNKWFDTETIFESIEWQKNINTSIWKSLSRKAKQLYGLDDNNHNEKRNIIINECIKQVEWFINGRYAKESLISQSFKNMRSSHVQIFKSDHDWNRDSILEVLDYALIDWASDDIRAGFVYNLINTAKVDREKAERMFWVYLSDNWFLDADEEYMANQNDILHALLLKFINKDTSIDFQNLEVEYYSILEFLTQAVTELENDIMEFLNTPVYRTKDRLMRFSNITSDLLVKYGKYSTIEEMQKNSEYWDDIFLYLKKSAPSFYNSMNGMIDELCEKFRIKLLNFVTEGNGVMYNNSLRDYVFGRYIEVGFLTIRNVDEVMQVLDNYLKYRKLDLRDKDIVKKQFKEVLLNKKDMSYLYAGGDDFSNPTLEILQYLMMDTNLGEIELTDRAKVSENFIDDEYGVFRQDEIKYEIESICQYMDEEVYPGEISLLKVNSRYSSEVKALLKNTFLECGEPLSIRIKKVSEHSFDDNSVLFELYTDIHFGYMDCNTSQAIVKINREIRPFDFFSSMTVDSVFIEYLLDSVKDVLLKKWRII